MKRTLSLLAVLAVAGFAGTPVQAASHYYASGMGGVSWMEDIRIKSTYSSENYTDTYRMDPDIALLGAYGWNYGRYRLEGEIGCHRNNFKSLVYSGIDEFGAPYSNTSYPIISLLFRLWPTDTMIFHSETISSFMERPVLEAHRFPMKTLHKPRRITTIALRYPR